MIILVRSSPSSPTKILWLVQILVWGSLISLVGMIWAGMRPIEMLNSILVLRKPLRLLIIMRWTSLVESSSWGRTTCKKRAIRKGMSQTLNYFIKVLPSNWGSMHMYSTVSRERSVKTGIKICNYKQSRVLKILFCSQPKWISRWDFARKWAHTLWV